MFLVFLLGADASHIHVHAWAPCCFHSLTSTQNFRRVLTALVDSCVEIKECPFSGVTNSGRVWRKVPESDAQSVWWVLVVCVCVCKHQSEIRSEHMESMLLQVYFASSNWLGGQGEVEEEVLGGVQCCFFRFCGGSLLYTVSECCTPFQNVSCLNVERLV